jgi:3-oxoacyl-[acyl-carrier protein] reductase
MAIDKDLDFTGETILVTGSGRNIGRAIILEFAARGANVIINSRTNEAEARSVEREAQAALST